MHKPIPWRKVAAVAFSATMMVGYVVFRTAYAQEGGADSRVLPSSKSGRVVSRQEQTQSAPAQSRPLIGPTTTPTSTTQITIQTSGPAVFPGSVFPGSKSTAIILPSDAQVVFNKSSSATTQLTGPPGGQPPAIPTTQYSLEPQRHR